MRRSRRWLAAPTALAAIGIALAGCGGAVGGAAGAPSGKLQVVAAENFWGSIAAQLGGDKVAVSSIIVNPNTDPHSYEPTASDGVAMARSQLAIVNGIGYDEWASKLLAANPSSSRTVLDVGHAARPEARATTRTSGTRRRASSRVIAQIAADYERDDPKDAAYFARQLTLFETRDLAEYDRLRSEIRARYAGVPVGYSESIFQPLGEDLHLKLATPYSFAKAIAEGADVSAARQADGRQPGRTPADRGVDLQQPERDARRAAGQPARTRRANPDHDGHRDALAGLGYLRAMAGRRASEPAASASSGPAGELLRGGRG